MLEKMAGVIYNGQFRDTGNIVINLMIYN